MVCAMSCAAGDRPWLQELPQFVGRAVETLTYADRVIGQPGMKPMKDLKGKRIGVPEGTSGDMILNIALEKAGMTTKDIQKINMDPSTVVSAFAAGKIDGAGIFYPAIATIKAKVPDLEEVASTVDTGDAFPTAFVAGNKVPETKNAKVIKVLQEANDWRQKHPGGPSRSPPRCSRSPRPRPRPTPPMSGLSPPTSWPPRPGAVRWTPG
ncbi:ABC transporter substrate-binding protein [Streptomyces sp. NPDC056656]|uniref:ABC transporter substrate-binding protein n=1 Tax=Streptomyces sp. NPDC056656 TaxID=3345895 RepID=UPI0036CD2A1C